MVICDICKTKIAPSVLECVDEDRCDSCEGDSCKSCLIDLESGTYCKTCVPSCVTCKNKLTDKTTACTMCEEEIHKTCAVKVYYDEMPERGYNQFNKYSHLISQGKTTSGWFCQVHATVLEEYKAESNIMIEYATKIFKTIGLPPLGIIHHLSPEDATERSDAFAQLLLKSDWKAILIHGAVPGHINITFRGLDFDTTIKVSTYNHEAAVETVREKLIKLLLHHKRNLQSNKRSYLDIDNRFEELMRGYSSITDKEQTFKAINSVTDMLRIITKSKNANIQD